MIKLSILIPCTHQRSKTFLPVMMDSVFSQWESLEQEHKDQVEILILTDNKKQMLGTKRNKMIDISQGKYVVHVDSDDRIEPDYIIELLKAIESDADIICFQVSVSVNADEPKICHYSKTYSLDFNSDKCYYRVPNHICCVKRSLALLVEFPAIAYGEDSAYAKLLKPLLKTEHQIDKVLYHYDFNSETTETQEHLKSSYKRVNQKLSEGSVMDVIILSNAINYEFYAMTQATVKSCITTSNARLNVIVMEQNKNATPYEYCKTHYVLETEFNYNKISNIGAGLGDAEWIMIANNDLIFTDGWLGELMLANHPLVSPKEPTDGRQSDIIVNTIGEDCGRHLSGWCFAIKRDVWKLIQGFDEDVSFWCSDNVVIEQCKKIGLFPMLVPKSIVEHLGSRTLKFVPEKRDELTRRQVIKYNKKYDKNLFGYGVEF
jgi:glycosyltransferase involved in cell wall biosynthesis